MNSRRLIATRSWAEALIFNSQTIARRDSPVRGIFSQDCRQPDVRLWHIASERWLHRGLNLRQLSESCGSTRRTVAD